MEKFVDLYNPESPAMPDRGLSANFDPRIHVRWENRPCRRAVDLAVIADAGADKPLLSPEQVGNLGAAGISSVFDILAAGEARLKSVNRVSARAASAVLAWAAEQECAPDAAAEIANGAQFDEAAGALGGSAEVGEDAEKKG